jgi:hypothetical protein
MSKSQDSDFVQVMTKKSLGTIAKVTEGAAMLGPDEYGRKLPQYAALDELVTRGLISLRLEKAAQTG